MAASSTSQVGQYRKGTGGLLGTARDLLAWWHVVPRLLERSNEQHFVKLACLAHCSPTCCLHPNPPAAAKLRSLERCSAALLMGCSSGRLRAQQHYEPAGAVLAYLLAGE